MASGDTLAILRPFAGEPPSATFAVQNVRNQHPVLEFDAATAWAVRWTSFLPANYAGGGITVIVLWIAATATTGNVKWNAAVERMVGAAQNLNSDSFATAQTATGAANGTSGVETSTSIALTNSQIDGLLVGEDFRLELKRDAADAADTMAGNAQVVLVVLKET